MFQTNSPYALNKRDTDAIVYMDINENIIRLTCEDFASQEEFLFWKAWSDEQYHLMEKADHVYANHTVALETLSDRSISAPGTDAELEMEQEMREQLDHNTALVAKVKELLTERQFRRLWLYEVEDKTEAEIAVLEGVGQRRISASLNAARRKLKKFFSGRENRG